MAASTLLGLPSCRFKSLSITARSSSSSSSQLYAATAFPSLSFSSGNSLNLFSTGLVSSKPVRRQLGGFIVCEAAALPKKVDSAVKRARQAEKRRMYNRARKSEVITRMKKVKCHGPDVDASEVFLATHSSVSPNGTRKWSSRHYQEIYVLEKLDVLRKKKDVQADEVDGIEKLIAEAYSSIDKAVRKGILHRNRNTGAQRKSRLARRKKVVIIHHGWYTPAAAEDAA